MTITVHHLQCSQSERIVWLCEELGLSYELQLHQRAPVLSPPEIKALNPVGTAPIIEDDSFGKRVVLAESGAIAEWLIQKHGDGKLMLPSSHDDYADFLYWFHTANGTLAPAVSRALAVARTGNSTKAENGDGDEIKKSYGDRLEVLLRHFDDRLRRVPYLAGQEFTVADIMSIWSFTGSRRFYPYSLAGYEGVLAWLERLGERAAYRRAREKGDPGEGPYLAAEPPEMLPALKRG